METKAGEVEWKYLFGMSFRKNSNLLFSIVYGDLQYQIPFEILQKFYKHNYLCQSDF